MQKSQQKTKQIQITDLIQNRTNNPKEQLLSINRFTFWIEKKKKLKVNSKQNLRKEQKRCINSKQNQNNYSQQKENPR